MQVNTSSNISLTSSSSSRCFSDSRYPDFFTCFDYSVSFVIYATFTFISSLLLLPLYILVLSTGFQRWRKQSFSHSDVLTFHAVSMEIIGVLGSIFCCFATYACDPIIMIVGYYPVFITYPGQTLIHSLACVERHLAVAHPITYRELSKSVGVKVRNISAGCVWLLCFGLLGLGALYPHLSRFFLLPVFAIASVTICFCSLSALIRLTLRKVGGDRERIDQSKQRAFNTIMAIMGTLVFRLCGLLTLNIIYTFEAGIGRNICVLLMFGVWLCLPSSLILPLMFLHRAGTLRCLGRTKSQGGS